MQLARSILQLFLLTHGHVRLHAKPFSLVDTANQRNLIFYLSLSGNSQVVILRPTVNKVVMNIYGGSVESESAFREEANGADKGMVVCWVSGWVVSTSLDA